jgi:hypothetical protein
LKIITEPATLSGLEKKGRQKKKKAKRPDKLYVSGNPHFAILSTFSIVIYNPPLDNFPSDHLTFLLRQPHKFTWTRLLHKDLFQREMTTKSFTQMKLPCYNTANVFSVKTVRASSQHHGKNKEI